MRRLSLAGEELSKGTSKVIDIAIKYGYDTLESFSRAFARFHGITPSEAKHSGNDQKKCKPEREAAGSAFHLEFVRIRKIAEDSAQETMHCLF